MLKKPTDGNSSRIVEVVEPILMRFTTQNKTQGTKPSTIADSCDVGAGEETVKQREFYRTVEQINTLAESANESDRTAIWTAFHAGLRLVKLHE